MPDDNTTTPTAAPLFQQPTFEAPPPPPPPPPSDSGEKDSQTPSESESSNENGEEGSKRRRRRRGGRGRRKKTDEAKPAEDANGTSSSQDEAEVAENTESDAGEDQGESESTNGSTRRRRRRRRKNDGATADSKDDDPPNTVVKVREVREAEDEVVQLKGSTRLEAKKQRRREGREAGRRRPPILSEAEFLARREDVERTMVVRQTGDLTQIAVLEDSVLVEHYVSHASGRSLIGNVYQGKVQNVLPAMEAAFIDIGQARNAVLYAGEINWETFGKPDGPKRVEEVLKPGQLVQVQVTKDPVNQKGARLTSHISLPGRYVVYVPDGSMNGVSRKLSEPERNRLKKILKQVVPEDAGVIVRTAAEGASEEDLKADVARLTREWEEIEKGSSRKAPTLLHGEPELAIKVVRDLFNEDFSSLVVSGDRAASSIDDYLKDVASTLHTRVKKWTGPKDVFAEYRVDEQIAKALDRKVWLPSGGSLVIDRTEAMTVIDVNTGKFTGSGGNLEETVTKNNLEAAEEIVRQLRLRDVGGIIVIDFIDMVLESNRDLVLRRLVECLGRDRTKHQVAEVTSLGLVQMTRKRIGTGLIESFSEPCQHCKGRGLVIHGAPTVDNDSSDESSAPERKRRSRKKAKSEPEESEATLAPRLEASADPGQASPADLLPVDAQETSTDKVETEPPKPARRTRRRVQRPAGSPTSAHTKVD